MTEFNLSWRDRADFKTGDSELSDLLYHGCDFAKWTAKTDAALRRLGLASFVSSPETIRRHRTDQARAKAAILTRVDPSVASSIRSDSYSAPHHYPVRQLWRDLERLSQPFRLMDLPSELRVKIFAFVPLGRSLGRSLGGTKLVSEMPPLLAVCRTLRKEALPLFYSRSTFSESCLDEMSGSTIPELRNRLRRWTQGLPAGMLQHLRSFTLGFGKYEPGSGPHFEHVEVEFSFCPKTGLTIANGSWTGLTTKSLEQCPSWCGYR